MDECKPLAGGPTAEGKEHAKRCTDAVNFCEAIPGRGVIENKQSKWGVYFIKIWG